MSGAALASQGDATLGPQNGAPPAAPVAVFEQTAIGAQMLVYGVVPISLGERLSLFANAPLTPRKLQRPINHGLFDMNARNQLEMF
jgi:hypothetical protein